MSWIASVPKSASFTKFMKPDTKIPTIELAKVAGDELTRIARPVDGGFTYLRPEKREYKLRAVSAKAMEELGITDEDTKAEDFAATLAGTKTWETDEVFPWAQNYAGYQFGQWAGQLGDGRAISLFEVKGKDSKTYELQLKGAGLTPYSRFADGKAVLRSSIREALCSEYMHALKIPTTRALAIVELPQTFARRERTESCAIVARYAESWVRFGTFDLLHSRGDRQQLRQLADYCLKLYPEIEEKDNKDRYFQLYQAIVRRNAIMIAKCQAYGFMNGVLNTDNTSILGLSMDYGPFAFMDTFDSAFTPNHDDSSSRYGFRSAPQSIWWNCVRLGEALGELIGADSAVDTPEFIEKGTPTEERAKVANLATERIRDTGKLFRETYQEVYYQLMAQRLGLELEPTDEDEIIDPLLDTLERCEVDYNEFFRTLSHVDLDSSFDAALFLPKDRGFVQTLSVAEAVKELNEWIETYKRRLAKQKVKVETRDLDRINPKFILKNWVLQDVIDRAQKGDWSGYEKVAKMIEDPFYEFKEDEDTYAYLKESPRDQRSSTCSCSS